MRFIRKALSTQTVAIPLTLTLCCLLVFLPLLLKMLLGELSLLFERCASGALSLCLGELIQETLLLFVLPLFVALIVFLWNVGQTRMSPTIKRRRDGGRTAVATIVAYAIIVIVLALNFFVVTYFYFPSFLENWLLLRTELDFDELPLYAPLFILTILLGIGVGLVSILFPVMYSSRTAHEGTGNESGRDA